jgi:non-specific serine/threonine protein kinase
VVTRELKTSSLVAEHLDSGVRYRLPETLREFGQECLQRAGEYTTLRRRHRDWHEHLAARADADCWLGPQTAAWEARLFREHANVRATQDFCQDEPGQAEAGLRIALHVWPSYYWGAGHISEGRYRLGRALAGAREPTVWRARGLLLASLLAAWNGDRGAAPALLAEGTGLARQLADPPTSAFAAWTAGQACMFVGDLPEAIARYEDGLAALPAAVRGRERTQLLLSLTLAAGLAGDEERVAACRRELAALTETGEFSSPRTPCTRWGWRPGDWATWTGPPSCNSRACGCGIASTTGRAAPTAWRRWPGSPRRHSGTSAPRCCSVSPPACGGRWAPPWTPTSSGWASTGTASGRPGGPWARRRSRPLTAAAWDARQGRHRLRPAAAAGKAPAPAVPGSAPLTARETQVARLVAGGRSNKEIAAQLVISQRTAEGHVENILAKLGFTSRAQVAAWTTSQPDDDRR